MITTQDALSPSEVPPSHRGRWIIGAVVAVLIIFVIWHILAQKKPARAAPPQVVKVAKAAFGDMPETLSELGTVAPLATVTVLPLPPALAAQARGPERDPNNPLHREVGQNQLKGRLRSHPDVARRHHSDLIGPLPQGSQLEKP